MNDNNTKKKVKPGHDADGNPVTIGGERINRDNFVGRD